MLTTRVSLPSAPAARDRMKRNFELSSVQEGKENLVRLTQESLSAVGRCKLDPSLKAPVSKFDCEKDDSAFNFTLVSELAPLHRGAAREGQRRLRRRLLLSHGKAVQVDISLIPC